MPRKLIKIIARTEAYLKGMVFDCHSCGQCILDKTGYICPMTCPKGLRNGPCGGTVNGSCEVYPDRTCVWVRILEKTAKGSFEKPDINPSPDSSLFRTSSYINKWKGRDKPAKQPLVSVVDYQNRKFSSVTTKSTLESSLKSGKFVMTTEVRSPREADFDKLHKELDLLAPHFDAINATAFLNGRPSLPSPRVAAEMRSRGIEPIAQATCRDHTKTSFVSELINNMINDVHNVLCLTGDSYVGTPKLKQVFDMDSSLMLYEARFLKETGQVKFSGDQLKSRPRPFLGAAINPFSTPKNIPIRRLKQKAEAGADFIQTQIVFDLVAFKEFAQEFCNQGLDNSLFLIAGIPVVTSKKAIEMLPKIPGIHLPKEIAEEFNNSENIREAGVAFARNMIEEMRSIQGVSGVHLMQIGSDHSAILDVVK